MLAGSLLRNTSSLKAKRTDQVKDTERVNNDDSSIDPSQYNFYWKDADDLKRHDAKRQYRDNRIEFQVVGMKHPDAEEIAMKKRYFGKRR